LRVINHFEIKSRAMQGTLVEDFDPEDIKMNAVLTDGTHEWGIIGWEHDATTMKRPTGMVLLLPRNQEQPRVPSVGTELERKLLSSFKAQRH